MSNDNSYLDFFSYLRRFSKVPSLEYIAEFSAELEKNKCASHKEFYFNSSSLVKNSTYVTQFALAFIASEIILRGDYFRKKVMTYNDLLLASNHYLNLDVTKFSFEPVEVSLIRMAHEQFYYQSEGYYSIVRMKEMISLCFELDKELERNFQIITGLNEEQYFWMTFIIYTAAVYNKGRFDRKYFFKDNEIIKKLKGILEYRIFDAYMKRVACCLSDFSESNVESRNQFDKYQGGLYKYKFNLLRKYPIIHFSKIIKGYHEPKCEFVVPNSKLMLLKTIDGIYWELRDWYLEKESDKRHFLKIWGSAFEKYVEDVLIRIYDRQSVFKVSSIIDDKNKNADLILINKDEIVIFECKGGFLPIDVQFALNRVEFDSWIKKRLIEKEGLVQLITTEERIINSPWGRKQNIEDKKIIKVLITYQNSYLNMIKPYFLKLANNCDLFFNNPETFVIMSIAELELMECLAPEVKFYDLISSVDKERSSFLEEMKKRSTDRLYNTFLNEKWENSFKIIDKQ